MGVVGSVAQDPTQLTEASVSHSPHLQGTVTWVTQLVVSFLFMFNKLLTPVYDCQSAQVLVSTQPSLTDMYQA